MSSNATNVASPGGHGAVAVEVVGSGELIGTLNGLGRMPTHIAPEARPTTSIAAIRVPKMTVWRCWRRSEEHTSELQSRGHLVCRLLLEKKKNSRRSPCRTSDSA